MTPVQSIIMTFQTASHVNVVDTPPHVMRKQGFVRTVTITRPVRIVSSALKGTMVMPLKVCLIFLPFKIP